MTKLEKLSEELINYLNTVMLGQGLSEEDALYSASIRYTIPLEIVEKIWAEQQEGIVIDDLISEDFDEAFVADEDME